MKSSTMLLTHIIAVTLVANPISVTATGEISNALSECTDELFLLENPYYQPRKGDYRIRNPSFYWKNMLEAYGFAQENYEKLDETQYEYMFHASHPNFGLEVYRICPKNEDYHKEGKIEHHLDRGHRMVVRNKLDTDLYLWQQKFQLPRNREETLRQYLQKIRSEKAEAYHKNYPIRAIFWDIMTDLFNFAFYLIMTSPLLFLMFCALS